MPSEPKFRDKDMNVDDVLAWVALMWKIAHRQFQDCRQWTDQGFNLAYDTWRTEK